MLLFYHAFIFKGRHAVRQRTVPVSARPVQAGTVQRVRHSFTLLLTLLLLQSRRQMSQPPSQFNFYHLIWPDVAICTFLHGATQQV